MDYVISTEPFGQNYPEELETVLDSGHYAICCRFNRWGSLLAVGCNDGHLIIFDFVTRQPMKAHLVHLNAVCAISWSRDGRKILTAGTEKSVALTDVLSGEVEKRFNFNSLLAGVHINPRNRGQFLLSFCKQAPLLINMNDEKRVINDDSETATECNTVACFDKHGKYIISGSIKGKITIHEEASLELIAYFKQPGGYCIRNIEVARRGNLFMTNSNDRVIRVYNLHEVIAAGRDGNVVPTQKVLDSVNRTSWKVCCFSGDTEYICAGSSGTHALYIWERSSGSVVKFLHGNKGEHVLDVVWHPLRTAVFSISNGKLVLWSHCQSENWSAFAPDFKELAENVEYEERESEFDLEDEDQTPPSLTDSTQENPDQIDIKSQDYWRAYFSSDDEEDSLRMICCVPEIEEPEEGNATTAERNVAPFSLLRDSSSHIQFPFRMGMAPFNYMSTSVNNIWERLR